MTPQAALIELLERLGANQGAAVLVNDDELRQWPSAAVKAMKLQKLIAKARPASSAVCPGCEIECVMPVQTQPTASAGDPVSFIVCDKRSDTNRVPVPAGRLPQWQCSVDAVGGFVAASLGLRRSDRQTADDLWEIGIATGDKRSQMLCLQGNGVLVLVADTNKIPLAEFIEYHDGVYSLDGAMIRQMVDAATTADNRYTPSEAKREARKLDTQAMYASWQKKYRELKRSKSGNTDSWYAKQIAKLDIANGRDHETIRKNMKK